MRKYVAIILNQFGCGVKVGFVVFRQPMDDKREPGVYYLNEIDPTSELLHCVSIDQWCGEIELTENGNLRIKNL